MRARARTAQRLLRQVRRGADPLLDVVDPSRSRCYPRDADSVEGYQRHFADTGRLLELFVKRCEPVPAPAAGEDPLAVVVMPWFATPAPWYSIAVGLGLARRGRAVTFVWHDLAFPGPRELQAVQHEEIGRVVRRLARSFPVVRVSEQPVGPPEPGDEALLDRLTDANMTWRLRGGKPVDRDADVARRMRQSLAEALLRVRSLLRSQPFRYALVPNGHVLASGVYIGIGDELGLRVPSFDAGFGATAVNIDGIAAHHTDTERAFQLLEDDLAGDHDPAVAAAREEFERRRTGSDNDGYQLGRPGNLPPGAERNILIPLSVIFDAAALGLHHIFEDSEEWLVETIGALLRETNDPIIVRQHPSERRPLERSRFDARGIVEASFGSNPQVRFIPAEEDLNSYDLLAASRLVVPFVSTIGMEAAALGKPVIMSGDVYYRRLGFVWDPDTREEYFDLLRRGAREELPLLPDQIERAWRCFYLNSCHRVWTNFTPQPPDFWRWVARQPDELYRDPDVEDILTSIDDDVPLSIVRHRRSAAGAARLG